MKGFLLFIFLLSLAMCQHSDTHYGTTEERIQRRKKIQKEICECLLKEDISSELKSKLEENKDQDLRHTLHLFMNKENSKDKEIIRKCRREVFGKMRDMFRNRKFDGFLNRTKYRHHPFLHERPGMHSSTEIKPEHKPEHSAAPSAKKPEPSAATSAKKPEQSAAASAKKSAA